MPKIVCTSKIRAVAESCSLVLNSQHSIIVGSPSDTPYKKKFPENVDIFLSNSLDIKLSGTVDGEKIAAKTILKSQLAQHLLDYFQINAPQLGLDAVSKIHLGADNIPFLTLTSSSCRQELLPRRVKLDAIELCYVWKTKSKAASQSPELMDNPFSSYMSLPFQNLLDNILRRFVTFQMVRRYPLIFGTWCQQLDVEIALFPKIFRAISGIVERSQNPFFRTKCRQLLKRARKQHAKEFAAESSYLSEYLGSIKDAELDEDDPDITQEESFFLSMEQVYRTGLRKPPFKELSRTATSVDRADDDELAQIHTDPAPQNHPDSFDVDLLWMLQPFEYESRSSPSPEASVVDFESDSDGNDMDIETEIICVDSGEELGWDSPPDSPSPLTPENSLFHLESQVDRFPSYASPSSTMSFDLRLAHDMDCSDANSHPRDQQLYLELFPADQDMDTQSWKPCIDESDESDDCMSPDLYPCDETHDLSLGTSSIPFIPLIDLEGGELNPHSQQPSPNLLQNFPDEALMLDEPTHLTLNPFNTRNWDMDPGLDMSSDSDSDERDDGLVDNLDITPDADLDLDMDSHTEILEDTMDQDLAVDFEELGDDIEHWEEDIILEDF
ncbi:hypothetical protein C8J56DRAFT_912167 [Mycena floridula]|nr:hypothetical protein C8J56DRAFT_912167 [Mycena floridula]